MKRNQTNKIFVGDVPVGGGSPVTVQSMTNTVTQDVEATVRQIVSLEDAGCHIIRSAITDMEDAAAVAEIKKRIRIPFIADVQFDHRLAIAAVEQGSDCLRINPGNIGSRERVLEVVQCCKYYQVPIRIGVNAGSLHQHYLDKYHGVNPDSIVHSALDEIRLLEDMNFDNMKISIKSSNVNMSIDCYRRLSELCNYPLHIGITEAGPLFQGTVKSSVGIGAILSQGIGDTIRVSITGNPMDEVKIGREILKSLDLLREGIDIISCPTCGRTKIDLIQIVSEAERELSKMNKNLKVAIMGCAVNGPGEAREADIGVAGGNGLGLIFKKGKILKRVPEEDLLDELLKEIMTM